MRADTRARVKAFRRALESSAMSNSLPAGKRAENGGELRGNSLMNTVTGLQASKLRLNREILI